MEDALGTPCERNTFTEARDRCQAEGSELADILDENFQIEFEMFMSDKAKTSELYQQVQELWFGGIASDSGNWKWIGNSQSFYGFSKWKNNAPECSQSICGSNDALAVNVIDGFQKIHTNLFKRST